MEEKLIEEEVARRVDAIVKQRVEEELSKRQNEIEAEVQRRVEEVKLRMEKQMLEELEKERQQRIEQQKQKEVKSISDLSWVGLSMEVFRNVVFIVKCQCWIWSQLNLKLEQFVYWKLGKR